MVQLKYFGDSRDYFKYDLITFLIEEMDLRNYVFVPMLTNHRVDNEGNKRPKNNGGKSPSLLNFIVECDKKCLHNWETWLCGRVDNYLTIEPVNETFFEDATRDKYWSLYSEHLSEGNALVFLDPDTGLETKSESYLRRMGREKYLLNHEIAMLKETLNDSSILMIYQHLPNNKHIHEQAVNKKLAQLQAQNDKVFVCGYREDDLVFLFAVKDKTLFNKICGHLQSYHERSQHIYKSLHIIFEDEP